MLDDQGQVSGVSASNGEALDNIIPSLYERLRDLAHQRLRAVPGEHSLNTTGLVHEAYLRLAGSPEFSFVDRAHFLVLASRVMRNVLVDHARARVAQKRGGGGPVVPLEEGQYASYVDIDGILDLDEALRKLELVDARQSEIVQCRYFGGLSLEETAAAVNLSLATAKRELRLARAWLAAELTRSSA